MFVILDQPASKKDLTPVVNTSKHETKIKKRRIYQMRREMGERVLNLTPSAIQGTFLFLLKTRKAPLTGEKQGRENQVIGINSGLAFRNPGSGDSSLLDEGSAARFA